MKNKKYDFGPDDKETAKEMNRLKKFITKRYGKECKSYSCGCIVCRVWIAFNNLMVIL